MTVDDQIKVLNDQVTDLRQQLATHVHNYAGANYSSGPALSVNADEDTVGDILLTGVSSKNFTKLMRDPLVKITGDAVEAGSFKGRLDGNAATATKLNTPFDLILAGDVTGVVSVDGSQDATVVTRITSNGVSPGDYGPVGNVTLNIGDSFQVPEFSISSGGLITAVSNKTVTIPSSIAATGTAGTSQYGDSSVKIFTVGSPNQGRSETTYTDTAVYTLNHRLFSNNSEVVNIDEAQSLVNKTYEGFKLGAACGHGVDLSTTGVKGSLDLVTSNALNQHVHMYADADAAGDALRVKLSTATGKLPIVVANPDLTLSIDNDVYVESGELTTKTLNVTTEFAIPGGTLWVDTSAKVVDVAEYNSGAGTTMANLVTSSLKRPNGVAYTVDEVLTLDDIHLTSLDGKVGDLDLDISDVKALIAACSNQSASTAGTTATLNVDVAAVKVGISDLNDQLVVVNNEVSTIFSTLTAVSTVADNALAVSNGLSAKIAANTADVGQLKLDLKNISTTQPFVNMSNDIAGLKTSLASVQADNVARAAEVKVLEGNLEALKNTVAQLTATVSTIASSTTTDCATFSLLAGATFVYKMTDKFAAGVTTYDRTFTLLVFNASGRYAEALPTIATTSRDAATYNVTNITGAQQSFTLTVR